MNRVALLLACVVALFAGKDNAAVAAKEFQVVTYYVKHDPTKINKLRARFHEVTNPIHASYGEYITFEEMVEIQRPLKKHVDSVRKHVKDIGGVLLDESLAADKIFAKVPAEYLVAFEEDPGHPIRESIDFVGGVASKRERNTKRPNTPSSAFRSRRTAWSGDLRDDPQSCLADRAVPPCIRKAYGIENEKSTNSNNSQAVIVNQGYKISDLKTFCSTYKLTDCDFAVKNVGKLDGEAGDEATLDVEYISATGQGVSLTWVYINGHTADPFSNWITWASNTSQVPLVHSLSVGEPEDEISEDNGGIKYIERMNNEMMALGARGVSILFASGDSGYQVAQKFPSSSPYVTSVGGVYNGELGYDELQVDPETTGGFSSLSANEAGAWQSAAVEAWTKTKGARPSHLNTSRRCCPDISIYDAGYYTIQDGDDQPIGGTSAAAPTLAGMISLINGHLLDAKKPPLGFLNYFLYQNSDAFLDITAGSNNGFDATVGYDPASGLGTFSPTTFDKLKSAALSPIAPVYSSSNKSSSPTLLVGLKHSETAQRKLDERFWAVADPDRRDATFVAGLDEIADIVRADAKTIAAAMSWLESIGAETSTARILPTGDAIEVAWPDGQGRGAAPRALSTFADYVILKDPSVPSSSTLSKRSSDPSSLRATDASMGPTAQKKAYGVPSDLKGTNGTNLQMVFGTGTFGFREDDISLFFDTYATSSRVSDVSFDQSNEWKGETGKNFVEGELDVSYIMAFAPHVRTLVANSNISTSTESGEGFGAALLAFLVDLNSREKDVPLVLSMSLGSLSYGSCDKVCRSYAGSAQSKYGSCWEYLQGQFQACMFESEDIERRIDAELAKLGLRGTTVTAASGDGASHFAFGPFSEGIGSELDSIICKNLNMPVYPTSSPYVLSVGGIQWSSDDIYGPSCSETEPCAWTDGGSGFSWTKARPSYQESVAGAYIKLAESIAPKTMPTPETYNASGRGYPDVATLAQFGIPLCTYGGCSGSGGTSASAPTVAGMLSLINDHRLNNGLAPLGFINTKLYKLMQDPGVYDDCFVDVAIEKVDSMWDCQTFSSCDGCNDGGGQGRGFISTKGWDAQTGFGQPKFEGWLRHLGTDGEFSD